jgi:UDP-N-acetylmuramoyl-tripeptide--D-alanyl-D-alanine ligase
MGAFAVGRHFGVSVSAIKEAIETYNPDNSRSQLLQRGSNTIILDAYNANPSSMSLAIRHFASADYPNKVVLLAAMKELGSDSQREHQEIVDQLQQHNWNAVVLVGGDFETTRHPYQFVARANDVVEWLKGRNFQHTAFLVKGSRAYQMETVLNAFQI